MNERQMQFRVGVVMFATMIIGTLLATLNGPMPTDWLPWGRSTYELAIQLSQAPGVGPNTPVRKNGLLIGRVSSIDDLDDGVQLRVQIDSGRKLLTSHVPHVRTSVLGDAVIDFVTTRLDGAPQPLEPGTVIPGIVDPNPFDAIAKLGDLQDDIEETMNALTQAGEGVSKLADRVNEAFGDETEKGRVDRILDTTERAMRQFEATMAAFNDIIGDDPNLDESLFNGQHDATNKQPADFSAPPNGQQLNYLQPLPNNQQPANPPGTQQSIEGRELRQRLRQGLYELPDAIRELRVVLESANRNFKNLEGFTEPLGQRGGEIARSIVEVVDGLERLVEEFTVLSQALNNRSGTIGQLLHNPKLYENLNALTHNANQVVLRFNNLTARLQVVVEDARVFMHKIALEPGRLVTGGLNPSVVK